MPKRLPAAALSALLTALFLVPTQAASARPAGRAAAVWHVVRPDETLSYIGARYGISARNLAAWNQLPLNNPIQPDAVLRLNEPPTLLPPFQSKILPVTAGEVNWKPGCPVIPGNLRKLWVSYIDFNGTYHVGSVVVRYDVARRAQQIFRILYNWRFRIMAMAPMRVNMPQQRNMAVVTAGYVCRPVGGTKTWSEHATGTAIDINPFQNPMLRGSSLSPANSAFYLNRSQYLIGMIHREGAARAFLWNGFHWGGRWTSLKDYMHFSLTNR
ncbi:M15 family metallopeptidase [Actinoplanes sp. TRM 88003]|uniref:M15 family metallopeptidase n=1 Tax=Paractinoplanes aksuensis TaxID=2939490 RepID=A0ABT1DHG5_9ACTN|nr:M15 family metallopeptidase [Actinoplanes aksuensis]MCO8269500.1 M15 family metallopeptidase [Actinoplanes aksuensis]